MLYDLKVIRFEKSTGTEYDFRFLFQHEPLSENLFRVKASKWRPLRTKLTPVFTSGKLKNMFHLLLECSEHFERYLMHIIEKNETVECRDLTARFTTDVIGSCAFGLDINAINDESNEFRRMGKKIFRNDLKTYVKELVRKTPWLYNIIGRLFVDKDVEEFFIRITMDMIHYRKRNNIRRHDFIDILMDLKDQEKLVDFGKIFQNFLKYLLLFFICIFCILLKLKYIHTLANMEKYLNILLLFIELTDTLITAQAFVFFAAGFETSSTTLSNVMYELAMNHTIQMKLRQEIKEVLELTDGKITYDCLKKMKYLDDVFQGTYISVKSWLL